MLTWLAAAAIATPHCPPDADLSISAHVVVDDTTHVQVTQDLELRLPRRRDAAPLPVRLPSEGGVVDLRVQVDGRDAVFERDDLNVLVWASARRGKTRTVTVSYTLILPEMPPPKRGRRNANLATQWLLGDALVQLPGYSADGAPKLRPRPDFSDDHAGWLADWRVSVDAPEGWQLIGPREVDAPANTLTLLGARELGFALCSDCTPTTRGPITLWSAAPQPERVEQLAHTYAGLEQWLGPLPRGRVDVLPVRGAKLWGMELPGFVLVEDDAGDEPTLRIDTHELAHQWWYDDVGADTHDLAWLDEGLTSWTTYHYLSGEGVQIYLDNAHRPLHHLARLVDDTPEEPLVPTPTHTTDWGRYHRATYAKPVAFFETLHRADAAGLELALHQLHSSARCTELTPEVLLDALTAHLDPSVDVESLWISWVLGDEAHTAWIEAQGGRLEPRWPSPDE